MQISSIKLSSPGSYIFHENSRLSFSLDRELGVVFVVPTEQIAGVVLYHPDHSVQDLTEMMDSILIKLTRSLHISSEKILVKIFGLSVARKTVVEATYRWLKDRNLFISAEDIGKNYVRQVLVDCATGKVGVSYSTEYKEIPYISTRTARDRNPLDEIFAKVMVLSSSPTKRTLAKQSIEEHRNWVADIPESPKKIFAKAPKEFSNAVVVLFDDLNDSPESITSWVENVHAEHPEVQFRFSGTEVPKYLRHLTYVRQLPPLTPYLLPEFKGTLARAIFDHEVETLGEVIPLKKKKA